MDRLGMVEIPAKPFQSIPYAPAHRQLEVNVDAGLDADGAVCQGGLRGRCETVTSDNFDTIRGTKAAVTS